MKICILTERMRLGFGVDLVVHEQARRLAAMGHDVVVIVIHADFDLPALGYRLFVVTRYLAVTDFGLGFWLRRTLAIADAEDADVFILHTPPFYDWLEKLPAPCVLIEYGAPPGKFFPRALGDQIEGGLDARLNGTYRSLLSCDAIVSISHSIEATLPADVQPSSTVIHLGADHYPRSSAAQRQAVRQRLGLGDADCMILWVGRMQIHDDPQPYKGFADVLAMAPLVRRHAPNARFVFAGRVNRADAASLAADGITVVENVPADEMAPLFAAADLLVNLSQWEGFNLALIEAEFQGTPVVAYAGGPHGEIVVDGKTGLLCTTPAALLTAVVDLASDDGRRQAMALEARRFAQDFTWDRNVDHLLDVVQRCAATGRDLGDVARRRQDGALRERYDASADGRLLTADTAAFVEGAYRLFAGKSPTPIERRYAVRRLHDPDARPHFLVALERYYGATTLLPTSIARTMRRARRAQRLRARTPFLLESQWLSHHWRDIDSDSLVFHAYRAFLTREPIAQEFALWRHRIDAGDRRGVLHDIALSPEAQTRGTRGERFMALLPAEPPSVGGQVMPPIDNHAAADSVMLQRVDHRLGRLDADVASLHHSIAEAVTVTTSAGSGDADHEFVILRADVAVGAADEARFIGELTGLTGDVVHCRPSLGQAALGKADRPLPYPSGLRLAHIGGLVAVSPTLAVDLGLASDRSITDADLGRIVARARVAIELAIELACRSGDFPRAYIDPHALSFEHPSLPNRIAVVEVAPPATDGPDTLGSLEAANRAVGALSDRIDTLIFQWRTPLPSQIAQALANHLHCLDIGISAPAILYRDGRIHSAGLMFHDKHWRYEGRLALGSRLDEAVVSGANLVECDAVAPCAFAIRRDLFEAIGGFDDGFGIEGAVIDLCQKVRGLKLSVAIDLRLTAETLASDYAPYPTLGRSGPGPLGAPVPLSTCPRVVALPPSRPANLPA